MLDKRFNFKDVESELLQLWDLKNTFKFKSEDKKQTILYYDAST